MPRNANGDWEPREGEGYLNNMADVWWPVPEDYYKTHSYKTSRLPWDCERFSRVYGRAHNTCSICGSRKTHVENYDMMWHDGDVVCENDHHVRGWDAG